MKSVKRKLKSVKEIKREKSMSTSNLTTRSSLSRPITPRKPLYSTVSTTNIAEVENENDVECSSSSTIQPSAEPVNADLSSVDSSVGPMDASSIASCSISQSLKENGTFTSSPSTDYFALQREIQSTSSICIKLLIWRQCLSTNPSSTLH